jgi:hypothetical protein
MDMQVRDPIAEHRRVHVLGTGYVTQSPARPRAPQAHGTSLSVGKISQPWRVPQWLH